MIEEPDDLEETPNEDVPPDLLPQPEPTREVRGILWLIIPALVGVVMAFCLWFVGGLVPFWNAEGERTSWIHFLAMALVMGGLGVGVLFWVVFPYQKPKDPVPPSAP